MSDKKIEKNEEENIKDSITKNKSKLEPDESQNPFKSKSENQSLIKSKSKDKSLIKSQSKNQSLIKSQNKNDSLIKSQSKNQSLLKSKNKDNSIKNSRKQSDSIINSKENNLSEIKEKHSSENSDTNSDSNSDSSSYLESDNEDDNSSKNDDGISSNKENTSLLQKNFGKKTRGSGSNAGTKNLSSLKKKSKHSKCVQFFCFNHVMHGNSLSNIKSRSNRCSYPFSYLIYDLYFSSLKIYDP